MSDALLLAVFALAGYLVLARERGRLTRIAGGFAQQVQVHEATLRRRGATVIEYAGLATRRSLASRSALANLERNQAEGERACAVLAAHPGDEKARAAFAAGGSIMTGSREAVEQELQRSEQPAEDQSGAGHVGQEQLVLEELARLDQRLEGQGRTITALANLLDREQRRPLGRAARALEYFGVLPGGKGIGVRN